MPLASISSVLHFFIQGGIFMLPLLLCSVISGAVILWRGMALRHATVLPPVIGDSIERLRPKDSSDPVGRLSRLVRGDPSSLGRVVAVALANLRWTKQENTEAVQTQARHEIVRLESGLIVLDIVTGVAPLLGLLGTVSGLVSVFATLGASGGLADPKGIAAGIAEALNTTIAGLAIAIPSLIASSYFNRKIESMSAEMESLVAELLNKCYHHKEDVAASFQPPGS
jgi:biopolymer transport protein ExbB